MNTKYKVLLAIASAALAVPAAGFAQPYAQQSAQPQSAQMQAGQPMVTPSQGHRAHPSIYPRFAQLEHQIRHEIRQGEQTGSLAPQTVEQLKSQFHSIKREEKRAYRTNGANLPPTDDARIQAELRQLAASIHGPAGPPRG